MSDTTTKTPDPHAPKVAISIRLRPATLHAYRQTGKGWQTRLAADLDRLVQRRAQKGGR